jgi:hypothetical protein
LSSSTPGDVVGEFWAGRLIMRLAGQGGDQNCTRTDAQERPGDRCDVHEGQWAGRRHRLAGSQSAQLIGLAGRVGADLVARRRTHRLPAAGPRQRR